MKIGELAQKTGLAPSRIRFYERIGLLKTVTRKTNGYREYPQEALMILDMITTGQQAGFSLDELSALLPSDLSSWDHHQLLTTLQQKVQELDELERKIAQNKSKLKEVLKEIEAKPDDMDCAMNAKRVMSQLGQTILTKENPSNKNKAVTKAKQR
ncbi:MerR family transcriptional regulator [Vibrio parahaemolyticus]|uniref:MerR family transcriptional regulator n=1 Tax=Vibrio parahaemolyticus TaxID=670 RepID=UPI001123B5A1|nr:MerR family transcriptional regulator [Vibrio parahaemolyticus]MBE3809806.1 MerR family DNA-binding transcriptional regulator [Vibrio parahaemolyticus]MBE4454087.1 MerR family DNA-binding transcriptional regulator [Vibrio parahaemolyticus]MDF4329489.1 MerR family DNA-binding transcriptional regulator [Vibrio parahaemolyticus]TOG68723.1 MerR family transcriptional regulator [Vibrio parahaemolyticus]TOQ93015.1 MerR family transcriptional regulator [Vibrio parahaemolyticus]